MFEDPVAKRTAIAAAIGAVIAIPLPIVGPIIGAVVGGAYGFMTAKPKRRKPRRPQAACRAFP